MSGKTVLAPDFRSRITRLSLGISWAFFLSILACRVAWFGATVMYTALVPSWEMTAPLPLGIV